MDLGPFSISLSVKEINKSVDFYEALGFKVIDGGHLSKGFPDTDTMKWRVLQNSTVKIGLFQGMFEENILTFNPSDVLSIQTELGKKGVQPEKEANKSEGFISCILRDPDGNQIMLDQISTQGGHS